MSNYLQRYISGEHEQVWADLLAQDARIRNESLYPEAWAVAVETMRRVRNNIELLIPRLTALGYLFGYDWVAAEQRDFAFGQPPVFSPPSSETHHLITDLEQLVGPLPLSLRAFYEVVGSVNFVGAAPIHWHVDERADPVYVYPIGVTFAEYTDWNMTRQERAMDSVACHADLFRVPIAPDYLHKHHISGGMWYNIALPNAAIDAELEAERHATTFVNYLRICFRWGGFPGLDHVSNFPIDVLASLQEGLWPI